MKAQLSLFSPPPPDLSAATWRTGVVPYIDTEMRHGYVHLVRAADDPERLSREEVRAFGIRDLAPHRTISKTPVIEWKRLIRNLLLDRRSSSGYADVDRKKDIRETFTFNRIMLELADVTADIAYQSTADAALWELASWIATASSRTRWRLRFSSASQADAC